MQSYEQTSDLLGEILEVVGIGLSPMNEELAEIAHRAMSGSIYQNRISALGMLAKLSGDMRLSRLHLSRALSSATLISDTGAEMRAMHQLGLLALSGNGIELLNYSSLQTDKPKQYLQIVLQILFRLLLLDILMGMKSYPNHI